MYRRRKTITTHCIKTF